MPQPAKPKRKIHLVTVAYDSGKLFHMWTSLLYPRDQSHDTGEKEAAMLRFRCFTRKLFKNTDVGSATLLNISAVETIPDQIRSKKLTVTDVLNYRDHSMRKPKSGTIYIWGKPSKNKFMMIDGPFTVNSKNNPEFFPKF